MSVCFSEGSDGGSEFKEHGGGGYGGEFTVGELHFGGGPGKCVFVPAGEAHSLSNPNDTAWVLRVTYHERVEPRHFGRILARALRRKLGLPS